MMGAKEADCHTSDIGHWLAMTEIGKNQQEDDMLQMIERLPRPFGPRNDSNR
jgi:hypothetical protein